MSTPQRVRYHSRIDHLIKEDIDISIEQEAHWAKYLCVLISGYLEVAVKEILMDYSKERSSPDVMRYVEMSWNTSQNMKTDNIEKALGKFSLEWKQELENWLKESVERKNHINTLISWRNGISHGKESNTNGVTRVSVREKFKYAHELVCELERIVPRTV